VKQTFSAKLLDWYDRERRHLPWRSAPGEHADPYHVWLSEVMLQQTTVATVKAYFEKFLHLWPTVEALAAAPQDHVLKEWAGLGYYARARNLHACAQKVTDEYGGTFPASEDKLLRLPGIGDYTAAAIAAIAFDIPATVVDGNIERVISRINRINSPLPEAKKPIKLATKTVTPKKRAGDFAQAMMDLGSSLCTPKAPKCLLCPVQSFCQAARAGDMTTYPVKKPKKPKPTRRAVSFWIKHEGHILLERRASKGLLGGMPGLFSTPWEERNGFPATQEWLSAAPFEANWAPLNGQSTHTFTHFHLETLLVAATAPKRLNIENGFWHPETEIVHVGLPTVFAKMAKMAINQN
jgi:A/G-specific adenine glycosylase